MSIDSVDPSLEAQGITNYSLESVSQEEKSETATTEAFHHPNPRASFAKLRAEGDVLRAARESQFPTLRSVITPEQNLTLSKLLATPPSKERDSAILEFLLLVNTVFADYGTGVFLDIFDELKAFTKEFECQLTAALFWSSIHTVEFATKTSCGDLVTEKFLAGLAQFPLSAQKLGFKDYAHDVSKIALELVKDQDLDTITFQALDRNADLLLDYSKKLAYEKNLQS